MYAMDFLSYFFDHRAVHYGRIVSSCAILQRCRKDMVGTYSYFAQFMLDGIGMVMVVASPPEDPGHTLLNITSICPFFDVCKVVVSLCCQTKIKVTAHALPLCFCAANVACSSCILVLVLLVIIILREDFNDKS